MRAGLIIHFDHQGHKKWVVVNVNDCRACIVPLANRDPENPNEVFDESESSATGISPNSDCKVYRRVKGQIKTRVSIIINRDKRETVQVKSKPEPLRLKTMTKGKVAPLPPIPEDPEVDPVQAVLNATSRYFS